MYTTIEIVYIYLSNTFKQKEIMTIKQAEKISTIYKQINGIHQEIVNLNKIAETILATEGTSTISLSTKKVNESKKSDIIDSDGNLKVNKDISASHIYGMYHTHGLVIGDEKKSNNEELEIELKIDDILTLEVLGVLISKKQREIDGLLTFISTI